MTRARADALVVLSDVMCSAERRRLAELAARSRSTSDLSLADLCGSRRSDPLRAESHRPVPVAPPRGGVRAGPPEWARQPTTRPTSSIETGRGCPAWHP